LSLTRKLVGLYSPLWNFGLGMVELQVLQFIVARNCKARAMVDNGSGFCFVIFRDVLVFCLSCSVPLALTQMKILVYFVLLGVGG